MFSLDRDKLYTLEIQSTVMGKLYIQAIIEEILLKNCIQPSANGFYLKLSMPSYDDLEIAKFGEQILVKLQNDEFAFDYNKGKWIPVGMNNRMINPYTIKIFMIFQANCGRKIKEQGWLENGVKIQEAIVSDMFLISKEAPNPFVMGKCKTDYANPNEEEK